MASSLPNEVLQHVLSFLPCERSSTATLFAFTLVSKRFSAISKSNVAWAHHLACWTDATRSLPSSNELGTAAYYRLRKKMDREAMDCVRELARATHGRTDAIAKLVSLGLNVADRLREVMAMEEKESPEEWISLRYWAKTALGVILRAAALETWSRVDDEEDASTLFDSLAAFSVHKGASPARLAGLLTSLRKDVIGSPVPLERNSDAFSHLSHVYIHLCTAMVRFTRQQGSDPFVHEFFNDSLPFDPSDTTVEPSNVAQPKAWTSLPIVAALCALANSLPAEWDVQAQVVSNSRLVRFARRSSLSGEEEWFYALSPSPAGLLSRSALAKVAKEDPLLTKDLDRLEPESVSAMTARHAAEDLTALVLATPPSRDRTAGHFASLQMYLLFAPPSDTSAPVHAIIYRETHHSFPFDVGIVERFFLPRCHEDAKMLGSAICNAILDVEESAPLGIPDLETWEKEPKLQVGEIVTRGAVAYVVCRCWQQEEENYFSDDGKSDGSEEEDVEIQIWYLLLAASGETLEVEEDSLGVVSGCAPEQMREIERGVETGKYFPTREGERLVPSAWLEAAYPVRRQ